MSELTLRTRTAVKVRSGRPSLAAPALPSVPAGQVVEAIGMVKGDEHRGDSRWYELSGDRFIWAGCCDPVEPETDRPARTTPSDAAAPDFHIVTGVSHKVQGPRPHGLEGLIVHFDAYRIKAAGSAREDSDKRTVQMVEEGKRNGFHYVEISRTGKIYLPDGFDWTQWGSHAGESLCPLTGRTGVSRYYVGCEMNNPGMLYPTADADLFVPWYNAVKNAKGAVITDSHGRATRASATDESYTAAEARRSPARGNIKPGWYLPYSHAQFEALTSLILYLARRFPTFSIAKVFGHDEVAPKRKNDPGAALANPADLMTMEEFRIYLRGRL